MSALDTLAQKIFGLAGSGGFSSDTVALQQVNRTLRQFEIQYRKDAADAMAATTTAEVAIFHAPVAMKLTGIKFTASTGGLTAHATNYASLIVSKRDGAGGAAAPITTFASDTVTTDDCTQWVPKELFTSPYTTFTACLIPAGSVLTFQITKAASGVVVPGGVLNITLEEQ